MSTTHSPSHFSNDVVQRYAQVAPVLSADSLRGALLWWGLTLAAAAVGGWASSNAPGFYASLQLPSWAPPASVFGPVWGVLYLLMGISAWMVWRYRHTVPATSGLWLYALALLPNALWSWLFFNQHMGGVALLDITLLWVLVAFTIRAFWRVRPAFGMLLLPLGAWVSFAGVLDAVVWRANLALLG